MRIRSKLAMVFCTLIAGVVYGHSGATGIVKERMDAMQDMSDKSKLVATMFKGEIEFDSTAVLDAANTFLSHGTGMAELFLDTEHSRTGSKTEALPIIWEEWDDFNAQVNNFIMLSESLKNAASTTNDERQLKKAFFQATKGCSGCHKRFRKPKG